MVHTKFFLLLIRFILSSPPNYRFKIFQENEKIFCQVWGSNLRTSDKFSYKFSDEFSEEFSEEFSDKLSVLW